MTEAAAIDHSEAREESWLAALIRGRSQRPGGEPCRPCAQAVSNPSASFTAHIDQALQFAARGGSAVAVMVLGIDGLHLVNGAWGRPAGDYLLGSVLERLNRSVRSSDVVVRWDGDQFALAMTIRDPSHAVLVADKILATMRDPFHMSGKHDVALTGCLGIAVSPQDGSAGTDLVEHATDALHHAKRTGTGICQFYSPAMHQAAQERLMLESRIRRGLANGEFVAHYQPKVSSENDAIVGAEALVRWSDPERGLVPPTQFIPLAEETGLIEQIGARVLEVVCRQICGWKAAGVPVVPVSVNVAPRQFRSPNFVDHVRALLTELQLAPGMLELEITEGAVMHDVDAAIARMAELRAMGLKLAMDDFGVGYSSLVNLQRFPLTTLKMDRAFIANIRDRKALEIAKAIIGLSKGLDLHVVAEGCETAEQVAFVSAHGCTTIQGYHYSKPVPADEFEAMLRRGRLHPAR